MARKSAVKVAQLGVSRCFYAKPGAVALIETKHQIAGHGKVFATARYTKWTVVAF